jgi:hypothetical protein
MQTNWASYPSPEWTQLRSTSISGGSAAQKHRGYTRMLLRFLILIKGVGAMRVWRRVGAGGAPKKMANCFSPRRRAKKRLLREEKAAENQFHSVWNGKMRPAGEVSSEQYFCVCHTIHIHKSPRMILAQLSNDFSYFSLILWQSLLTWYWTCIAMWSETINDCRRGVCIVQWGSWAESLLIWILKANNVKTKTSAGLNKFVIGISILRRVQIFCARAKTNKEMHSRFSRIFCSGSIFKIFRNMSPWTEN